MPTHPHQTGVTRILKSSPACQNSYLFHPHSCLTKHINEWWIVNTVFFASQLEIWETVFQNCSHTYPIDKDMLLTFWHSFSLIVFFFTGIPLLRSVPSAIWQIFYELSQLATCEIRAKHEAQAWNICQFCTRLQCDN